MASSKGSTTGSVPLKAGGSVGVARIKSTYGLTIESGPITATVLLDRPEARALGYELIRESQEELEERPNGASPDSWGVGHPDNQHPDAGVLNETAALLRGQRDKLDPETPARRLHDRLISLIAVELAAARSGR